MRLILLSYLLFNTTLMFGQSPILEWAGQVGSSGFESSSVVVTGPNGQVIAAGVFRNTVDLDIGQGILEAVAPEPWSRPLYIQNLNDDGSLNWAKWYHINNETGPAGMCITPSQEIILVGKYSALWDIDPGPNEVLLNASSDAVAIKLSPDGNIIWATIIGAGLNTTPTAIAVDSLGFIYTTGRIGNNCADFDPGPGTVLLCNDNGRTFIHKMTSDGELVWVRQLDNQYSLSGTQLALDGMGSIYLTGSFADNSDLDLGPDSLFFESHGFEDIWIMKMTTDGDMEWVRTMGGAGNDKGEALSVTASGKVVVAGYFRNTVDFNSGSGVALEESSGDGDIFIMQLSANGELDWVRTMGGVGGDGVRDMFIDNFGHIHVVGYFRYVVDFDPGPDEYILSADSTETCGYTLTFDPLGGIVWIGHLDGVLGVSVDSQGAVYYVGSFNKIADLDPTLDGESIFTPTFWNDSTFSSDAFVLKLNMNSLLTSLEEETERTGQFTVAAYPNPGSGAFTVALGSTPKNIKIKVVDITGKTVLTNSYKNTDSIYLNFEGENGIYLLHIITDEGNSVIKLVKQ